LLAPTTPTLTQYVEAPPSPSLSVSLERVSNVKAYTHTHNNDDDHSNTMINIYVARHGQDVDNSNGILNGHRNEPLTELGRRQAEHVGKQMLDAGFRFYPESQSTSSPPHSSDQSRTAIRAIYSSPLQRAFETAEIFAKILSTDTSADQPKNVQILDDLIERDFGIMTGMPTSSILEKCGKDHVLSTDTIHYFLDPDDAETFPELIARGKKLLTYIETEISCNDISEDSSILLVTHGDFGKMLYAAFYDLNWEEVLTQFHFGNSEVLLLAKDSPPEKAHVFETSQYNS
jgi:probable phosphoglycerate mutase